MPGLITHYICADAVSKRLERKIQTVINENRNFYNIGAQGPDVFFYYIPGFLSKNTRGLGSVMHGGGFAKFCEETAEEITRLDGGVRGRALAYFGGYITHYALDCAAHPYIYAKAEKSARGKRLSGIRKSVRHRSLETGIDTLMLEAASGEKPSDTRIWRLVKVKRRESFGLSEVLARCVERAYGKNISRRAFARAFSHMAQITRILQSEGGRRKRILETAELALIGERVVSCMIHEDDVTRDFLNVNKKTWSSPWDRAVKRQDSFIEMFERAVIDAERMITAFFNRVDGKIGAEELAEITGDRSFASGR